MARRGGVGLVLLAHHRRDQAETFLLQALRGAGVAGLSAMPRAVERDGCAWARPWLEQPREAIEAYVRQHRLRHVDDDSNADPRFARNRLRAQVWPALLESFADAETALVAVARRAHEADEVLREVAAADLTALADGERLDVTQWATLSAARRVNALRVWLQRTLGRGAPESLVARLRDDLPHARSGRWPVDGRLQLALHRGHLSRIEVNLEQGLAPPDDQTPVDLSHAGVHTLPRWGGSLEVSRVARGGVAASALKVCTLRARRGGEQFQARPRSVPRSLKKQYQAAGAPAWARDGPLVYVGDQLLFVPGLGFDARALAAHGAARGLVLRWRAIKPARLNTGRPPACGR